MISQRHKQILNILFDHEDATVEELAKKCQVSQMTVRRDLDFLQTQSLVKRTHGGATINRVVLKESSYHEKSKENLDIKKQIAQKAMQFIKPNSSIFLDAGTTTYELALCLYEKQGFTIITNDLMIAKLLYDSQNTLFFLGGKIQQNTGSSIGIHAQNMLEHFNIDISFVAAASISHDLFLETSEENKYALKKNIINNSAISILIADDSKFSNKSLFKICHLSNFNAIITNYRFSSDDLKELENSSVVIV